MEKNKDLTFPDLSHEAQMVVFAINDLETAAQGKSHALPPLAMEQVCLILTRAMDEWGEEAVVQAMKFIAQAQTAVDEILKMSDEELRRILLEAGIDPDDPRISIRADEIMLRSAFAQKNRKAIKDLQPK